MYRPWYTPPCKILVAPVFKEATAIEASSIPIGVVVTVKRTAWPPGKTWGQRWLASPAARVVKARFVPADSETTYSGETPESTVTMLPSSPHLAPRGKAVHTVTGAPPVAATFFSLPSAK